MARSLELSEAIRRFETQLEEQPSADDAAGRDRWKSQLNRDFDELCKALGRQQELHAELFNDIADQDLSQHAAIRKLKRADEEVGEFMDVVRAHLAAFGLETEDDDQISEQLLDLQDAGHKLAECLRSQEALLRRWLAATSQQETSGEGDQAERSQ